MRIIKEENRPVFKDIKLAGQANASIDLGVGEHVISINDVNPENSVMGLGISHVFSGESGTNGTGTGFKLNLEEKLVLNEYEDGGHSYTYTDANGRKYHFTPYYYYLNDDNKKEYVLRNTFFVDIDGVMQHNGKRVYAEYRSATGLNLVSPILGIINVDTWLDQRNENLRQAQEKKESLKNAIRDYRSMSCLDESNTISDQLKTEYDNYNLVANLIDGAKISTCALMPRVVAEQYQQLLIQKKSLEDQDDALLKEKETLEKKQTLLPTQIEGTSDATLKQYYEDQKSYVVTQLPIVASQRATNSQQITLVKKLLDDIKYNRNNYVVQFESNYKAYILACQEVERLQKEVVARFLTDGKQYKGYNADGDLVVIFDSHQNSVVIEREFDYVGSKKWFIKRVYDNMNNSILFNYLSDGKLSSIVDTKGVITKYEYDNSGKLISIKNDKEYSIEYNVNGKPLSITENISKEKSVLAYNNIGLNKIENYSLETDENGDNLILDSLSIDYVLNASGEYVDVVTISNEHQRERYYLNYRNLYEYRLEENGVVVKAQKYDYVPYWQGSEIQENPREVVINAKKSSLFTTDLDNYIFVEGEEKTTVLNEHNMPEKTTYSQTKVGQSNVKKKVTIEYFYDDNKKLIKETTTEKYTSIADSIISHKEYTYNQFGEVVKIVSYTEGREDTYGKAVEEYEYDEKGNVIKSFTYNTLDSSNKFYTEKTYDESGKTLSQKSETGENEVKFNYANNRLVEENLPNGSKFAYGYDDKGNLTSISHSTVDGESNSTERIYQNGLLTTLKSGKNEIHYTYDFKRRIKSIDLNGTKNYLTYTYTDDVDYNGIKADIVLATYAPRYSGASADTVETITDKKGNVLCVKQNGIVQIEKTYEKGLINTLEDKVKNLKFKYTRDDLDNVTSITSENEEVDSPEYSEQYILDGRSRLTKHIVNGYTTSKKYKEYTVDMLDSVSCKDTKTQYEYDPNGRIIKKEYLTSSTKRHEIQYSYLKKGDHATNLVSTVRYGYKKNTTKYFLYDTINYTYDEMGNITHVKKNGVIEVRYTYDNLSRLVREDNKLLNKTYTFLYDNNGNILFKKIYDFTLCTQLELEEKTPLSTTHNKYGFDQLKENGPYTCTYDKLGNPTIYKNKSMIWECGRRLKKYKDIELNYDGFGRRIKKGELEFTYDLSGRLLGQSNGIEFIYDENEMIGLLHTTIRQGEILEDGTVEEIKTTKKYHYQKDVSGNVIALLDEKGIHVVNYVYDAWGNHEVVDLNGEVIEDKSHIGHVNPIRYRSYYYDSDFGFYYLKTRYYDPKVGRFINMDDTAFLAPDVINGLNLYAYCGNNPVMNVDPNGKFAISAILASILIGAAIGAGSYTVGQVIEYAITGTFEWSWGGFIGSIVGGAISGLVPGVSVFASTVVISATTMIGENISGDSNYSIFDIAINSIISGMFASLSIGIFRNTSRIFSSKNQGAYTMFLRDRLDGTLKMFVSHISGREFVKRFLNNALESLDSSYINWHKPLIRQGE